MSFTKTEISEYDEAKSLLSSLVACDSINPPGKTMDAVKVISDYLITNGVEVQLHSSDTEKPNLVASVDNGIGNHLILNAHLDTVQPGDLKAWSVPLFELTKKDQRFHGLGTGNMKAGATAMVIVFLRLKNNLNRWKGKITLTLVSDECNFGEHGAEFILKKLEKDLLGDFLICGEGPGNMNVAIAEKGLMWVHLIATGPVGQGMINEKGKSAPSVLAKVLNKIDSLNLKFAKPPCEELNNKHNYHGQRITANIGKISGGDSFSPAVSRAEANVDFRIPPGLNRSDIKAYLSEFCAEENIEWHEVKGWDPNWSSPTSKPAIALSSAFTKVTGRPAVFVTRIPASDASRWRTLGVPSVCFGPQPELVSGVDDYVNEKDFLDCLEVYALACIELLA